MQAVALNLHLWHLRDGLTKTIWGSIWRPQEFKQVPKAQASFFALPSFISSACFQSSKLIRKNCFVELSFTGSYLSLQFSIFWKLLPVSASAGPFCSSSQKHHFYTLSVPLSDWSQRATGTKNNLKQVVACNRPLEIVALNLRSPNTI